MADEALNRQDRDVERSRWDVARSVLAVVLSVVLACAASLRLTDIILDTDALGPELLVLAPLVLVPPAICALVLLNSPRQSEATRATLIAYGVIFVVIVVVLGYANSQSG